MCKCRGSNPRPHDQKSDMLTTRPSRWSVTIIVTTIIIIIIIIVLIIKIIIIIIIIIIIFGYIYKVFCIHSQLLSIAFISTFLSSLIYQLDFACLLCTCCICNICSSFVICLHSFNSVVQLICFVFAVLDLISFIYDRTWYTTALFIIPHDIR